MYGSSQGTLYHAKYHSHEYHMKFDDFASGSNISLAFSPPMLADSCQTHHPHMPCDDICVYCEKLLETHMHTFFLCHKALNCFVKMGLIISFGSYFSVLTFSLICFLICLIGYHPNNNHWLWWFHGVCGRVETLSCEKPITPLPCPLSLEQWIH